MNHTGEPGVGQRTELLGRRISELGPRLDGTRLERLVHQLYDELHGCGLTFLPPVYVSNEWVCPSSGPIIAAPFHLAEERVSHSEAEPGADAEMDAASMRRLRHAAGHAFNSAYRLYDRPEWHRIFGPYSRPYNQQYHADPFSRAHVRHIRGWCAQKHPDEDFAETFAVWMTPDSDWHERYAGWAAINKLQYIDSLMREVGGEPPVVSAEAAPADLSVAALHYTVGEQQRELEQRLPIDDVRHFDGDLQTIFERKDAEGNGGNGVDSAGAFLRGHHRELVRRIGYWSGEGPNVVGAFIDFLARRGNELQLARKAGEASTLIELTAFGTAVMLNYRYTDRIGPRAE